MASLNRRKFLKSSIFGSMAAAGGVVFSSGHAFAKMCSETTEASKNLLYVANFKKAMKNTKVFTKEVLNFADRANPGKLEKAEDMDCSNCIFYGQVKPKECPLLAGCEVHARGWCKAWAGKA